MNLRHVISILNRPILREGGPYECSGCGERFAIEYYSCPDCGGYRVERIDWDGLHDSHG